MITHGIETFSDSKAAVENLATIVGCLRKQNTSYHDVSTLTNFVLCTVLIWLFVVINQRRGIAVVLNGQSGTWLSFVALGHAIRNPLIRMRTASSIRPQHMRRTDHSLPRPSVEVSRNAREIVMLSHDAGRETMLQ
jgi:uncharacterized integral membrane protein